MSSYCSYQDLIDDLRRLADDVEQSSEDAATNISKLDKIIHDVCESGQIELANRLEELSTQLKTEHCCKDVNNKMKKIFGD